MAGNPTLGWAFFGTLLCGIVFALPIIIGYYIVQSIMSRVERRKEKVIKDHTVV